MRIGFIEGLTVDLLPSKIKKRRKESKNWKGKKLSESY